MQKSVLLLTFFFICCGVNAQFYFNDVLDLKASNKLYANLAKNNVQYVTANSMEADGTPTTGFVFARSIQNNGTVAITHTELETGGISDDTATYNNGLLIKSANRADNVFTTVEYSYDNSGNILTVKTQTEDTAMGTHSTELHQWFFTGNIPDSMLRIKDGRDTTFIHFKKDDHNNIAEELWMKRGRTIEHYYYYYNEQNKLTDIVRFNTKAQQMLPDFLIEYNEDGVVSQVTQIPQGSSDYVVWQYVYDERGLKTKDVLFDKHKELLGTVTYIYR